MRTEKEVQGILEKLKEDKETYKLANLDYKEFTQHNNTGDPGFPAKTVYGYYFTGFSSFFKNYSDDIDYDIIDHIEDLWYDNKINTMEEAKEVYVKELASYKTTGKYSFKKRFDPQVLFHYISDVDHGFRDPVDNIYDIYK
jgi:hypothetical protein